ncbi:MAG TPA: hypothetical protein VGK73_20330, partial [Polyangiaceae bacterium]
MSQETASPSAAPSTPPEPPEAPRADRSQRLGRTLRRALFHVRALVRAVPAGRMLRAVAARFRLLLGTVLLLVVLFLPALDRALSGDGAVANGVTSGNLNLSRLEPAAVAAALGSHARLLENRPLVLRIAG